MNRTVEIDFERLVVSAQQGDRPAFDELVAGTHLMLRKLALLGFSVAFSILAPNFYQGSEFQLTPPPGQLRPSSSFSMLTTCPSPDPPKSVLYTKTLR